MAQDSLNQASNVFTSNGNRYVLEIMLFADPTSVDPGDTEEAPCQLRLEMENVRRVEMEVSLDRLYYEGFIIYRDVAGDIGRYHGKFDLTVAMELGMEVTQKDGMNLSKPPEAMAKFNCTVNNLEIVEKNDDGSMTYCIRLVDTKRELLRNHPTYTTHDGDDESPTSIVMSLMGSVGLKLDQTFEQYKSDATVAYMTSAGDTIQSAIDFLMQKQFFYANASDQSMKFIVYDHIDDKYKLASVNAKSYGGSQFAILVSFDETSPSDRFQGAQKALMVSESDIGRAELAYKLSKLTITSYDADSGNFSEKTFTSQQIANYFAGESNELNRLKSTDSTKAPTAERCVSDWSNDTNLYLDMLQVLCKWDSILVNMDGTVVRKLLDVAEVKVIPPKLLGNYSHDRKTLMKNWSKSEQLGGKYLVTGVRYIIAPGDEDGFKQNVRLSRTQTVPTTKFWTMKDAAGETKGASKAKPQPAKTSTSRRSTRA